MFSLPFLATLLVATASASTRTAVAFRTCPEEASLPTPTGGSWANLVENMARVTASSVRETAGLELALPRDWSVRNNRLLWRADCAWSDGRLAESLEDDGVEQILVVSSTPDAAGRALVVSQIVDGHRLKEWRIAPPTAQTVDAFAPVEEQFAQAIDHSATPPVNVVVNIVDEQGRPVPDARWELIGVASGVGSSESVRLVPGEYRLIATAGPQWMAGDLTTTVAPGGGAIELTLVKKAHLVLDIPRRATVLVDGKTVSGPGDAWVTPNRPLTVLMRKGERQYKASVQLHGGEEHTLKMRFPLFD